MNRTVLPGPRTGRITILSSKSVVHRMLICAAFSDAETEIVINGLSDDIEATADCLRAFGADILSENDRIIVRPVDKVPDEAHLYCRESGSTLRFLMPFAGVLGTKAVFHMEGRLPERPLEPFLSLLNANGMKICKDGNLLICEGRLNSGNYELPGNVSSQYISGMLMALPLVSGNSTLTVIGEIESSGYIGLTEEVIRSGNAEYINNNNTYSVTGIGRYHFDSVEKAEGDWSNAAFYLCMGAMSRSGITVDGLNLKSVQGDRAIVDILRKIGADVTETENSVTVKSSRLKGCTVDAADIPDLIPAVSTLCSMAEGETRIINASRLRLKESDRLSSTAGLLRNLGADVRELPDGLVISGVHYLKGGTVDTCKDHRIAMSSCIAACGSTDKICIKDSECVNKSYRNFFEDFDTLEMEDENCE